MRHHLPSDSSDASVSIEPQEMYSRYPKMRIGVIFVIMQYPVNHTREVHHTNNNNNNTRLQKDKSQFSIYFLQANSLHRISGHVVSKGKLFRQRIMSSPNDKRSGNSDLPEGVLEILLKMPMKTLLQFKCVCKKWYNIISSQSFVKEHYGHMSNKERLLIGRFRHNAYHQAYTLFMDILLGCVFFQLE